MGGVLSVVVGGQFGSEAKGAVTARLARRALAEKLDVHVVRVAGPNAGHTAYDQRGVAWALRQVPAAAVVDPDVQLYIAAGSEIDIHVLHSEVTQLERSGIPIRNRLLIDEQATILLEGHVEAEIGMHEAIGSTGKGVGAARAARIMRRAEIAADHRDTLSRYGSVIPSTDMTLMGVLTGDSSHVIIEGTQGYGLGLHAGYYPQCTSSDCRAIDFLAMAGIDPSWAEIYEVWVVLRRFPIRVAGNSGPLEGETTWEALGLPEERTTVTKKVRRVGEWDPNLAARAVLANGGPRVVQIALTMADQQIPGLAGIDGPLLKVAHRIPEDVGRELVELIERVQSDADAAVALVGTGPNSMLEL